MALPVLDCIAARYNDLVLLLARLALGAIFVESGFGKLTHLGRFVDSLAAKGVVAPNVLAVAGTVVELGGGLAVVLGLQARAAALAMVAFTIAATLISHHFWTEAGPSRALQFVQFMKNLAIIGGFLLLFAQGAGLLALDRLGRRVKAAGASRS